MVEGEYVESLDSERATRCVGRLRWRLGLPGCFLLSFWFLILGTIIGYRV